MFVGSFVGSRIASYGQTSLPIAIDLKELSLITYNHLLIAPTILRGIKLSS